MEDTDIIPWDLTHLNNPIDAIWGGKIKALYRDYILGQEFLLGRSMPPVSDKSGLLC